MSSPGVKPACSTALEQQLHGLLVGGRGWGRSRPRRPPRWPRPPHRAARPQDVVGLAPQRSASAKETAPTGTIMNSWKSTLLSAWAPPLSTFIIGTGSTWALGPPR